MKTQELLDSVEFLFCFCFIGKRNFVFFFSFFLFFRNQQKSQSWFSWTPTPQPKPEEKIGISEKNLILEKSQVCFIAFHSISNQILEHSQCVWLHVLCNKTMRNFSKNHSQICQLFAKEDFSRMCKFCFLSHFFNFLLINSRNFSQFLVWKCWKIRFLESGRRRIQF